MARYEIHQVRKHILADQGVESEWLRPALVLLECLNWNTKEKTLSGMPHLKNWLTSIGQAYGQSPEDMKMGVELLRAMSLIEVTVDRGQITLAIAERPEETDELF